MTVRASKRIFCCWEGISWCKVIGWFQIIHCFLYFILLVYLTEFMGNIPNAFLDHSGDLHEVKIESGILKTVFVLNLPFLVVGFAFGLILLKGAYDRNPDQLKSWLLFASVNLLWNIFTSVVYGFIVCYVFAALYFVVSMIYGGFTIWMVRVTKSELELDKLLPETFSQYDSGALSKYFAGDDNNLKVLTIHPR